jgi:uncharacterized caspase-like protein
MVVRIFGVVMRRLIALLLIVLAGSCFASRESFADKRVALVIGISKYQNVPQLPNPVGDAAAMADVFKKANFDRVDLFNDLTVSDMRRAVREFAETTADADLAVVYYAGHGIEVNGANYLIPADARLVRDFDVEDETVSLDRILQALDPAKRLRLVILDACRDNPFAKTMKRSIGTRSIGRGLAKIEPTTTDTLIAFAAKAGAVAGDGEGNHSPFATALIKYIAAPGLDLRIAFGKVRDDVMKSTGNRQEPFVYGSLGGADVSLVPATPQVQAPQANPQADVRRDYELALQLGTREAWESFIVQYPSGFYTTLAKGQLGKIAAEEARVAATAQAKAADDEKQRLAADKASAAAQARAGADAKVAEDARLAAEKAKKEEAARADAAERARAAAERAAADQAAKAQAAADAKAIRESAQAEAKAIRDKAEADAKAAEQARKDSEREAERLRVAALEQAKSSQAPGNAPASPNPAADGTTQVAALPPAGSAALTPQDIARSLQTELRRVGCFTGAADGEWKTPSQRSLEQFNKYAGVKLDVKLASADALDAVKGKTARVCPLICDHGLRADADKCVKITCKAGYAVGSDNSCEKVEPKKPVAKQSEPPSGSGGSRTVSTAPAAPAASGQIVCSMGGCRPVAKGCHLDSQGRGYGSNGTQEVCN